MAAREPIFKMTFSKSTSSDELIPREIWDLKQKTEEIQYLCTLAIVVYRDFFNEIL